MPIPKKKPIKRIHETEINEGEDEVMRTEETKKELYGSEEDKFIGIVDLDFDDLDLTDLDLDDIDGDDTSVTGHDDEASMKSEPETAGKKTINEEPQDTGFMEYSRRAYEDGYTFKHLPLAEQRMTNYLYVSEDGLSSFYLALQTAKSINDSDERPYFKYGVGMPKDGRYLAYVYDCTRSRSKPGAYVIKLLVSDCDMRCFTFSPGLFDPISVAISRDLKIKNNVFKSNKSYSDVGGHFALFKIENVETQYGGQYSEIKDFKFLSDKEYDVVEKMINIMFEQA